ncbi:MAG: serine--tRNA ligase [Candidatus Fermentibacteraceae bacterium]|nr:serine--tRNA ligase [Candidatus Fermentibacteraceae bacterium]MBN2609218.1 serine--tRNA ligase [Candidatus Fermentibacteraceae bacterium]
MLDRDILRNDPERVRTASVNKGEACPIDEWLDLDESRRSLLARTEDLRRRRNELSTMVSSLKKQGLDTAALIRESREVGRETGVLEKELSSVDARMAEIELRFTNIPDPDIPVGKDESSNRIVRTWGEPDTERDLLPHWEILGGSMDQEASGAITGANFILLRGWAAWLQRILINWMVEHNSRAGMEEIWFPFVANRESMAATGQIPKLEEDMYHIEKDDLFLVPTGEVPLTNIYRDSILLEKDLPIAMCGYSPCFRREAGSYGKDTRGLNRVHQFEKVEMVRIVRPEDSPEVHEEMVSHAGRMLELLELPYRVSLLSTGDLGFAAARCYDLEVWAPGQKKWLEVSSVSNFRDFQARRGMIRYRPSDGGRPRFVHTLNGSALALPRVVAALVENGQTEDGRVRLPAVLAELTGVDRLG